MISPDLSTGRCVITTHDLVHLRPYMFAVSCILYLYIKVVRHLHTCDTIFTYLLYVIYIRHSTFSRYHFMTIPHYDIYDYGVGMSDIRHLYVEVRTSMSMMQYLNSAYTTFIYRMHDIYWEHRILLYHVYHNVYHIRHFNPKYNIYFAYMRHLYQTCYIWRYIEI